MKPILVILAAGMGSRYGGLKQLDPVGPDGASTLLDYAVHDARQSGFGRLVFVIRREFEGAFRREIVARYASRLPVEVVFQEVDDLPAGFTAPTDRTKPWGTGHAVWCARGVLTGPFAVLNADDFYGRDAMWHLAGFLAELARSDDAAARRSGCMIGYELRRTLSEHGAVSRGVCTVNADGTLRAVEEHSGIERGADGALRGEGSEGRRTFEGTEVVSMNCWGLPRQALVPIERGLTAFLSHRIHDRTAEYYLPAAIAAAVHRRDLVIRVQRTNATWFGVTYREDRPAVQAALQRLVEQGAYPARLDFCEQRVTS